MPRSRAPAPLVGLPFDAHHHASPHGGPFRRHPQFIQLRAAAPPPLADSRTADPGRWIRPAHDQGARTSSRFHLAAGPPRCQARTTSAQWPPSTCPLHSQHTTRRDADPRDVLQAPAAPEPTHGPISALVPRRHPNVTAGPARRLRALSRTPPRPATACAGTHRGTRVPLLGGRHRRTVAHERSLTAPHLPEPYRTLHTPPECRALAPFDEPL